MAKQRERKTNAQREVEAAGFEFSCVTFEWEGETAPTGVQVADILGEDVDSVFKTLVTVGHTGEHYVFMVPVACELDLKKAAMAVGEKSIAMIRSRELLPLTGYIHGGCSPIGMKKRFRTTIDETAELFDRIYFSGGRIGCQLGMAPNDLDALVGLTYADIVVD